MVLGLPPGDNMLVVSPHHDDDTLGAGGTIARLTADGIGVHVLAIYCHTHPGSDPGVRAAEFEAACNVLGVASHRTAWTDTAAAASPGAHLRELVTLIESGPEVSLRALRPSALLLPAAGSFHQDHQAVHTAGIAAARPSPHAPRIVLGYVGPEDAAWGQRTDARRPLAVDTSGLWETKAKALTCYGSQLREAPHPRSLATIRALDTAAGSFVGTEMAELLTVYRLVV
ncbi:PIG-L deacetylase family protein [Streptomyces globisporus]|uniref:PIG-L deacetylase family protein n=1 Tax=Streptomyces globisporus TaxID=1908 RepID=UPI0036DA02CE